MLAAIVLSLCLTFAPVEGPVTATFDPSDRFGGHWGVDLGVAIGTDVRAPADGVVTFAGSVAGMRSVTIRIADDVRVSMSYLSVIEVVVGTLVDAGDLIGRSGRSHGPAAVHVSVRVGGRYVDPIGYLRCQPGTIRLLPDR